VVSKSTTATVAMKLLRRVPGIHFGPDVVTWQALVSAFAESTEMFQLGNDYYTMSAITIESSEFGNLLNPADKEMVDLLVTLWDGKEGSFQKRTKMSGDDQIQNPWINIIACTTPSWIAGNFPEYMIGGGFTSRCVFVYAEEKRQYVAYPGLHVPKDLHKIEDALVQDLEHIALNIAGEYKLDASAVQWGQEWYEEHYTHRPENLTDERFGGYIARKQTHIHKLAMVLAASRHNNLVLTAKDLQIAAAMVTDLEQEMPLVFARIGRPDVSLQMERFVDFIRKRGRVRYTEGYKFIHAYFPSAKEFEDMLAGCVRAGLIEYKVQGNTTYLIAVAPEGAAEPAAKVVPIAGRKEPSQGGL
jgi:hypothetical protein